MVSGVTVTTSLVTTPASTGNYALSLHDALPICPRWQRRERGATGGAFPQTRAGSVAAAGGGRFRRAGRRRRSRRNHARPAAPLDRSEEHTSELQSRGHLVCRLLLGKINGVWCYGYNFACNDTGLNRQLRSFPTRRSSDLSTMAAS